MASRRDAQSAATRRDILKVAKALFGDKGYHDTSIGDIASRIGAARSALYYHFPNKLAIFRAVVAEYDESVGQEILESSVAEKDGWKALKAGAMRFLDACEEPRYRRIMLVDAPVILHPEEPEPRRSVMLTAETLAPLLPGRKQASSMAMAYSIVGVLQGLAQYIAHAEDPTAARNSANGVFGKVLEGLKN